ncbi:uncharacterized protein BN706_00233 [Clostridium sp. CAG:557]|nr:uncharacterized protein BN706_00233 [Clostridium sp. CAG:557]
MHFIDIHDVGYGECIVFEGEKNEILMVDCGSMNTILKNSHIKFKDYVSDFIMPRYDDALEKSFLLTHFHRDHFCGLKYILKKQKKFFDNIYIPYPALNESRQTLLLEMAIYAFTFLKRQQACASMSTSALFIFDFLRKNSFANNVIPLKRDDIFEFAGIKYNVLNPFCESFPFSQGFSDIIGALDALLKKSLQTDLIDEFFHLRNLFCREYINCCDLCRETDSFFDENITESIKNLNFCTIELNNLSKKLIYIDVADEIMSFLNDENTRIQYSSAQNSASIVFQNELQNSFNGGNILMTADVTRDILNLLENDLFQVYNVIKAPHHGTNNYQSDVLNRLTCSHIIISNGEYHAGSKISVNYANNTAIKHCVGTENCDYLLKSHSCCNRILFCDSLQKSGELSSHCLKNSLSAGVNRCGIYVVSPNGDRGCYCD